MIRNRMPFPLPAAFGFLLLALPGCGGGGRPAPSKDLEFSQSMDTARVAYERGQTPQAILLYTQAMRRAESRDDAADIGEAAYNLGVCLFDDNQLARAEPALETARLELGRAQRRTNDVRLVQAKLAKELGKNAKVNAATIATEVANAKDATAAERAQAFTLLAGVAIDAGRPEEAEARIADAGRALGAVPSGRSNDAIAAGIAGILGRLATSKNDPGRAAAEFDRQATLAQSSGLFPEMASALLSAGRAYGTAGNQAASADRLFRAARSLIAQSDPRGIAAAGEAVEAAGRANDATLAERSRSLVPTSQPAARE